MEDIRALQQMLPELGFVRPLTVRRPRVKAVPLFVPLGDLVVADPYTWMRRCDYQLTDVPGAERYLAQAWQAGQPIAVDIETTGLNRHAPDFHLVGVSLSGAPFTARYLPLGHHVDAHLNVPMGQLVCLLDALSTAPLVFHHAGFDLPGLRVTTGWSHPAWSDPATSPLLWHDTMILSALAHPLGYSHGLKHLAATQLGTRLKSYADTLGPQTSLQTMSPVDATQYACGDADATLRLFHLPIMQPWLQHQVYRLERGVTPVLADALDAGLHIDRAALAHILTVINPHVLASMDTALFAACGTDPFDLGNPDLVGQHLCAAGVPLTERTKTGQLSTHKFALAKLDHPLIKALQTNREWHTFYGTYVQPILAHVAATTDPHPLARFPLRQLGAPTGRMAGGSGEDRALHAGVIPTNIQSWPEHKRRPDLPNQRTLLHDPRPDWQILSIDYSQIELRIAANRSMEPRWIAAYQEGRDLHQDTADTLSISRLDAKTVNFAILYGASAPTIAARIHRDVEDTQDLLDRFFASVPLLHAYIQSTIATVTAEHRVLTLLGRVRPFPVFSDPEATVKARRAGAREAVNTTIQGSAADLFKAGLVRLRTVLRREQLTEVAVPVLFIHDEVNLRVHVPALPRILPAALKALEFPANARMPVPILVEAEIGPNWGETTPLDLALYRK